MTQESFCPLLLSKRETIIFLCFQQRCFKQVIKNIWLYEYFNITALSFIQLLISSAAFIIL